MKETQPVSATDRPWIQTLIARDLAFNEGIEKVREEMQTLRGCSCSNSDGIIDNIEEILDKHLGEIIV